MNTINMQVKVSQLSSALAAMMLLATLQVGAQSLDSEAPPGADDSAQAAPPDADAAAPSETQIPPGQLDQMLAPIALYPDALLGQILMASTYPLEVVQADRWLQDPNNAALKGDQLNAALEQQPWDPSVKSLVPFPQILRMMDNNLTWTEQLGDAFLANQNAVMDSVQRLRQKAQAAGTLQSSPQEVVATQGPDITVEPANADTVSVPVYDPDFAYGDWSYPDYPPDYFPNAFGGVTIGDQGFGWFSVGIYAPLWGWNHWDWRHHRLNVDGNRFNAINVHHTGIASGTWHHDPAHRFGVPYRNAAVSARFRAAGGTPETRRGFRGFPSAATPQSRIGADFNASAVTPQSRASTGRSTRTATPQLSHSISSGPAVNTRQSRLPANIVVPQTRAPVAPRRETQAARQAASVPQAFRVPGPSPAFESFGRGADIRPQAQRGRESFQTIQRAPARTFERANEGAVFRQQAAPVVRSAPVMRAAPVQAAPAAAAPARAGGGERGGGGGGGNRDRR